MVDGWQLDSKTERSLRCLLAMATWRIKCNYNYLTETLKKAVKNEAKNSRKNNIWLYVKGLNRNATSKTSNSSDPAIKPTHIIFSVCTVVNISSQLFNLSVFQLKCFCNLPITLASEGRKTILTPRAVRTRIN